MAALKRKYIRSVAVAAISLASWVAVASVSWVGFQGCGGDDGGSGGGGSVALTQEEEDFAQAMVGLAVFLAGGTSGSGALAVKNQTSSCGSGGSFTVNPDGSITFNNCSFGPGQFLNGTMRFTLSPDGTQQTIEFDQFSGQSDDTLFEADGTIKKKQNGDGSTDFEFDLNSSTTGGGETDETNLFGSIRVEDDFSTTGLLKINDTNCNFNGEDIRDFAENSDAVEAVCDDEGEPVS